MSKVAAIAVGHRCQNPLPVIARRQFNFRDARKVFPKLVFVFRCWSAEPVKPYLLVEVQVLLRPFALVWIARVKQCRAVPNPGGTATSCRKLDPGNFIRAALAIVDFNDMERSLFAAP